MPFCPWDFPGKNSGLLLQGRDLPNPGIKAESPALAGRFFTTEPSGKPYKYKMFQKKALQSQWVTTRDT